MPQADGVGGGRPPLGGQAGVAGVAEGPGHAGPSSTAFYLAGPQRTFADLPSHAEPTPRLGLISKNTGFAFCF